MSLLLHLREFRDSAAAADLAVSVATGGVCICVVSVSLFDIMQFSVCTDSV